MANNEGKQSGANNPAPTMVYACSGASDVGEIADQAARQIARSGAGKMSCLAGIAADKPNLVTSASSAPRRLVIDGCPLDCGRKVMENAGLSFDYVRVTDLGLKKGEAPVTKESITLVADACTSVLAAHGEL